MISAWSAALWLFCWLEAAEAGCSPTSYYRNCWIRRFPGLYIAVEESERRGAALLQLYQEESALKCSRACCLSTNFSCNLAVFHYNTTQDSANCFHLHCPTLESCILRQRGNVILYNVTKGVDPDLLVFGNQFTSDFQILPNQARLNNSEPFSSDKRQFNRPHMGLTSSTQPPTPATTTSTPTTSLTTDVPDSTSPLFLQSTQDTSPASSVQGSTLKTTIGPSSTHVIANLSPHTTTTTTSIPTTWTTTVPQSSKQQFSTIPLQPTFTATTTTEPSFSSQLASDSTYQTTVPAITTLIPTTAPLSSETRQASTTSLMTNQGTQTSTTPSITSETTQVLTTTSVTDETTQASTTALTTNEGTLVTASTTSETTQVATTASTTNETTQTSTIESTITEATWASTTESPTTEATLTSTIESTTNEATQVPPTESTTNEVSRTTTTASATSEATQASTIESTTNEATQTSTTASSTNEATWSTTTPSTSSQTTTSTPIPPISTQQSTTEETSAHSTLVRALQSSTKPTTAPTLLTTVKTTTQDHVTTTSQPPIVMITSQTTKTLPFSQLIHPLSPKTPLAEESSTQSPTTDGRSPVYTSNNAATTEDSTRSTRLHSQAAVSVTSHGSVSTSPTPPTSMEDSQPYPNDTKGYISRNITTGDSPRPGADEGLTPVWHLAANTVLVALATCATIAFGCCCSVLMAVSWRGRRRRKGRYRTTLSGKRGSMRLIKYVIVRESL